MSDRITQPGIYRDFSEADYFADPTPAPSLTQSIAKILLDRSPLHAWHAHPRLNPDYRHDDDTKFDVGNVAHKLLLGRGKEIVVVEFDDWRTKAAKEAREQAAIEGRLAVLGKKFALAERMVKAAREQLELRRLGNLFTNHGSGEVMTAWKEGDIWCRQLIDWLSTEGVIFADYKTTDMSAAPHTIGRMMVNAGWPIQAAMGERGLRAIDGDCDRYFFFVVQETAPPYCLTVVKLSRDVLTMGHKMLQQAIDIWSNCMAHNRWPGYSLDTVVPEYPPWAESAWLEREIADAARDRMPGKGFDPEILMAG